MLIVLHSRWLVDLEFFVMLGKFYVRCVVAQEVVSNECKNDHFLI